MEAGSITSHDRAPSAAQSTSHVSDSGVMAPSARESGHSVPIIRRPLTEESWIEVSSRPSTSSLSSAATDEVVTTGLRVSRDEQQRRRRRLHRSATTHFEGRLPVTRNWSSNGSSQEEYEESEADSDRIMSSSNDDLQPRFLVNEGHNESRLTHPTSVGSDADSLQDDEDEIATALGPVVDNSLAFTPQPNIFSHPPSTSARRQDDSYFPPLPPSRGSSSRPGGPSSAPSSIRPDIRRARSHTPFNVIAPSASLDHDAALRASLSTLLSCAAAARGLSKREPTVATHSRTAAPPRARVPSTIRIVPESALGYAEQRALEPLRASPPTSNRSSSPGLTSSKRKSKSPVSDKRKRNRSAYDTQHEDVTSVSPTLTTWVVGAGVLVLFSAISFTAGYTLGKEVGRVDALGDGAGALSCASEVNAGGLGHGLAGRRSAWRWGNTSSIRA